MERLKALRGNLGGQLGVGLTVVGLLLVFLGWNGAASNDTVVEQFPYLLSGGIAGLALVVVGVGLLIVQNQRADRVALQASIDALRAAVEKGAGRGGADAGAAEAAFAGGLVIAGATSFHQPTCRVVEGRDDASVLTTAEAVARGLEPCRLCRPGDPVGTTEAPEPEEDTGGRRRQLRGT